MTETATFVPLEEAMREAAASMESMLDSLLPAPSGEEARLLEAMRYATLGGGKRLRPFLVLCGARLCGASDENAFRVGAAIEMVHCYSLIHDDLPAMDDDDLRRGRASCHKAFDDATAILAGDALQALAFEVLAAPATHEDPSVRSELGLELARAAGGRGMVGGQMVDLAAEHSVPDVATVTRMQQMKTGALIRFSCEAGAILAGAPQAVRHALQQYANDLGLAFQIVDDLLDVEGDSAELGKATQKDAAAGKATFVNLLGIDQARQRAGFLVRQATAYLDIFGEKAAHLRQISKYVLERQM